MNGAVRAMYVSSEGSEAVFGLVLIFIAMQSPYGHTLWL
jgi:hypothetical protein